MAQVNIQYTADISQLNSKLDQIIQKQDQLISSSKKAGDEMVNSTKRAASETEKLDLAIGRLSAAIASAFAVSKVIEFTKSLIDAERKMELLQNRLNFLAGGADMGQQMFVRLEATSRRLGLTVIDTAEGLASFGIAAKQAGFSAQKSEKLFIQVATGLRAAGASSLQTQRAFYALQQMMSKGVVAAEELRRQLGESLPGASDLMTKAYNRLHPAANLTNLEFTKLLETGKIISKDILPVFAQVIEETFAPALAGKQNSLDAALNKVNNEILKLKLNIGNADWFKSAANVIGTSLFELNAVLSSESLSTLDKIYASLFVGDPEKTKRTVGAFDMIQSAVDEYNSKVGQAITTNNVFGDALEKNSEKYKALNEKERDLYKKKTNDEIEANKEIIKSSKELLKENDAIVEAKKKMFEENIKTATQGKTAIQAYAIEQKLLKDLSAELKKITENRTDDEKQAETAAANAISRNEFLEASLIEFYNLDEELNDQQKKRKEESDEAEKQRLKDDVYRAQARVELAMKGSQEENEARAQLAEKQMNLDVFLAKSDAQAQLARVIGEKESNKQIEDSRRKLADLLSDLNEEGIDIDPNLIKRLNNEINTLKEIFSDAVIEDEIIPSEDIALKAIDKQLEILADNRSAITRAIATPYLDATELEIADTILKYNELIKLTEENSEERIRLEQALQKELANIREKSADDFEDEDEKRLRRLLRNIQQAVNTIGGFYEDLLSQDLQRNDIELKSLEKRLDKGLISEQEYESQKEILLKRQFETEKSMQLARAVMSGANSILSILGGPLAPLAPVLIPIVAGITASQIAIIQSQVPGFKDGVIDLKGPGTETSDSIVARLSKGESVMTASETRKHKDVLQAIRNDRLPSLIAEKYIIPAYKDSMDKPRKATSEATSMELAFQTAELVQAVKSNKVINLSDKSVNRLASAMNKNAAMDKKIRRRGL
jgi:tape measure domain-containing protein